MSKNTAEISLINQPDRGLTRQHVTWKSSGMQNLGQDGSLSDITVLSSKDDTDSGFQKKDKFSTLTASTEKLLHSGREENKPIKAVFGVVAGLVTGGLLFILLTHSFGYNKLAAGICALICTVFICIGLAIFPACRCVMALVFPNFFTGKGRAILLSVIFAIMLTGPISNIAHNARETGSSMACVIDLLANQTKVFQKQVSDPVKDIARYVDQQREVLKEVADKIRIDFGSIKKILEAMGKDLDTLNNNLNAVYQNCRKFLDVAYQGCRDGCQKIPTVPTIPPITLPPITLPPITLPPITLPPIPPLPPIPLTFSVTEICLKKCSDTVLTLTDSCTGLKIGNSFLNFSDQLKLALTKAEGYFKVDIAIEGDFTTDTNSSKDIQTIQDEVNEDIGSKVISFQKIMTILNYVLSLSLLLMFLQAFVYFKNYMAKDGYDNVYITKDFIKLDKTREDEGEEAALPLKKVERTQYTYTTSLKLNKQELGNMKTGLAQVFIHFIFCIVVIIFDYFLFYLLNLVHNFGNIELDLSLAARLTVTVKGNIAASFYRSLFKGIDFDENFLAEVHIGKCLPNPTSPTGDYATFILLYLLALGFVVLRGYGIRLRRKIAAYYYPEQEAARMEYLKKTIRHGRIARQRFLRQELKSMHKESSMKEKFRLSTWLVTHCPCMAKCIPSRNKLECSSCEEREGKFSSVKLTKCPGEKNGIACTAVYCEDCKVILNSVCPLCSQEEVKFRD